MNKFKKYCENVYIAECEEAYEKGDLIQLENKYGKECQCEVYNHLGSKNGLHYYSIVRTDQESYAQRKANKYATWAEKSSAKSDEWQAKASEGKDFLALAEPIKIGHHSEKRHRALIERNNDRMRNCISELQKAESHKSKAEYWEAKSKVINLSMPESLEYFAYKADEAEKYHLAVKNGSIKREHSYTLQYANKEAKSLREKHSIAVKLWGEL